ncbi:MAG: F0F1 ATP synthase subunit alpha, partial [Myxococcales bacterium]|nr:F0F1 ATP synthase subunit alpha [Myxococcales bacterium]
AFAQFASDLDQGTRDTLNRGQHLVELLKQNQYAPLHVSLQVASIYAGTNGHIDDLPLADVREWEAQFHGWLKKDRATLVDEIASARSKDEVNKVGDDLDEAVTTFNKRVFKKSGS